MHSQAVQYLSGQADAKVQEFGKVYKEYAVDNRESIPRNLISHFKAKCKRDFACFNDMYKDALLCLFIGSQFKPLDETFFLQVLLPYELETQLWFRLKFAAYDLKDNFDDVSAFIATQDLPRDYVPVKLEEVQKYMTEVHGREYFINDEQDTLGKINYFKVLMLIGLYTEAL